MIEIPSGWQPESKGDLPTATDLLATRGPAASFVGRRVGPYLLESELGRGGMGSVWLARRDDGQYQAKVAIKLLAAAWLGEEGQARFRREGTLLARLDHPNIARLLDAGVTERGEPYLVLEYVEGESLDAHCKHASLDVVARIELFLDLLGAVAHAHRNLIVHRDIKPANVLVTASGQPKLLDFGIGRLLLEDDDGLTLTRTGHVMLTPAYAAPEQLLGNPVTTATDIYALGSLLYLLLTGRHAYQDVVAVPAELIRRVTTGIMPLPSSVASMPGWGRILRGDLDNIVIKAMHPAPEERYEHVGAFAADLQHFLRHEPVRARAAGFGYCCRKFIRRHRAGVAATVLVLFAGGIAGSFTIGQVIEARRQRAEAQYQSRSAELMSDFFQLSLFSEGGPDRPALTMSERIDRGAMLLEKQYEDEPGFAGRMMIQLADRSATYGETAPPMKLLTRAYEFGRRGGDAELMASAQCNMVQTLVQAGVTAEVVQRLRQAQRLLRTVPRPQVLVRIECLVAEAQIEHQRGDRTAAVALLRQAAAMIENARFTNRPMYASVLSYLAIIYADQNDFAAAIAVSQQEAAAEQRAGRADTSEHVSTLQNIAALLSFVGEISNSLVQRERVNQLIRRFVAADELPFPYVNNHATLLLRMQHTAAAAQVLDGCIERARAAGNPSMLLQMLHLRAWAHVQAQEWLRADRVLEEAGALMDSGAGSRGLRSEVETRRAQVALGHRDAVSAHRHIEAALVLAGYGTGQTERSLSRVLITAAEVALAAGRTAQAERFASDALRFSEQVARGVDSSADVGEALLLLAKARRITRAQSGELRLMLERSLRSLSNGLHVDHPLTIEARTLLAGLAPG